MKNINSDMSELFDDHFLLERLTKLKDPLVKLDEHIDWNIFAPTLDVVFNKPKNSNNVGRPPFDRLMMFKLLILQSFYNLSHNQMEYQITDRRSFMRFLGLKVSDKVPDAKTIWNFRETLIQEEVIEALFYRFNQALDDQSVLAKTGQIVDASIVQVPRQRNTREENKQIKQGETPEVWKKQPNKLCQKDRDARWLKKNGMSFYGFKNHIKVDQGTKLISTYMVTDASVHDSQELETLIDKDDVGQQLYGDSAYTGQEESIEWCSMQSEVYEKGTSKGKLTDKQKVSNRKKSKARARAEHVFGYMTNSMNGMFIKTIGLLRAAAKIGLSNLTYNMMRFVQLKKPVHNVFLMGLYNSKGVKGTCFSESTMILPEEPGANDISKLNYYQKCPL